MFHLIITYLRTKNVVETCLARNMISLVTVFYVMFYFEQPIYYVIDSEDNSLSVTS